MTNTSDHLIRSISDMSEITLNDRDHLIVPQWDGLLGFFPDQVESLVGCKKYYMGDLAHDKRIGVAIVWFSNIYDKTSEKYLLGVYGGMVTNYARIHGDTSVVRFSANGTIYTVKSNHWAFVLADVPGK